MDTNTLLYIRIVSHIELILAYGRNINYKMFLLQRLVNYAQT